jgi:hypothetical protein
MNKPDQPQKSQNPQSGQQNPQKGQGQGQGQNPGSKGPKSQDPSQRDLNEKNKQ